MTPDGTLLRTHFLPDVRSKNLLFSKVADLLLADATANTIKTDMFSTFSAGTGTPLYFSKWMPISITAYTGTCVFLIILAISFRVLIAFRSVVEERRINTELNKRYVVITRKSNTKERISSDSNSRIALLTENGLEEDVIVVRKKMEGPVPWSIAVDGSRAVIDTIIAGIFFLLMLSIMTMNVGYFLSVLSGTFLGSLAIGSLKAFRTKGFRTSGPAAACCLLSLTNVVPTTGADVGLVSVADIPDLAELDVGLVSVTDIPDLAELDAGVDDRLSSSLLSSSRLSSLREDMGNSERRRWPGPKTCRPDVCRSSVVAKVI
ncbi:hypothetical protein V494_01176 [Pseudogymnoascus sp. VKM F-4513 (FW-928)]|nr:hypothetical protein V494_01176 [Pseudogymnoascus sp. VKM F-4513 (FW-928)]